MATDLALICSGSPGFFRNLATGFHGSFRLIECYSLSEATHMLRLHNPAVAILDIRSLGPQQMPRAIAAIESAVNTRFSIVMTPGQLAMADLPPDIAVRTDLVAFAQHSNEFAELAQQIQSSTETGGTDNSQAGTDEAAPHRGRAALQVVPSAAPQRLRPAGVLAAVPKPDGSSQPPVAEPSEPGGLIARYHTRTPELRQMLRRLEVAARHSVTILLIGETGSGKTHLASLIHEISPRTDHPFLHVACGALPGELIESELFGHVKGAFTSAHADKDGKFLVAGRGTILLDEIDVLTPDQQVKLLRVIEKGEFEPVGSNETLRVQARVIAASNVQLQPLVEQGRFRPDLYYRLNTLSFTIPPLRRRLPDLEPLARYFVHRYAQQFGIDVVDIAPEFMDCLLRYPWPGNVREMENAIRSAVIYSVDGRMTEETLPSHIVQGVAGPANDASVTSFLSGRRGASLEKQIDITEKDIIEQALLQNNFSRTRTARHLGISRVTLYNKMKKYGIMPER